MPESLGVALTPFSPRDLLLSLEAKMHLGEVGGEVVDGRLIGDFAREYEVVGRR